MDGDRGNGGMWVCHGLMEWDTVWECGLSDCLGCKGVEFSIVLLFWNNKDKRKIREKLSCDNFLGIFLRRIIIYYYENEIYIPSYSILFKIQ